MRAQSRVLAGLILITGTLFMAVGSFRDHPPHTSTIILTTWALAIGVFVIGLLLPRAEETVASVVVPSVGAALLLPLTIHMPLAILYYGVGSLDTWCMLSVLFVGIAHVGFATMIGKRAAAIARGQEPPTLANITGVTIALSGVPGLLVVLPVFITALTLVPMLPLIGAMTRWCQIRHSLPAAIVVRSAA